MIELSKKLKEKGYYPGIISNFARDLIIRPKPERDKLFNPVVYSGELGIKKPNLKIYKFFFERS